MRKKLFNKVLKITTSDNKEYTIENKRVFIHGSSEDCIYADIMQKGNNIYIINEIYGYENKECIIRFLCTEYVDAKVIGPTIELDADGNEIPVIVIENYDRDRVNTFIDSIGNITELTSDFEENNNKHKDLPKILKLLRKNKDQEDLLKVA